MNLTRCVCGVLPGSVSDSAQMTSIPKIDKELPFQSIQVHLFRVLNYSLQYVVILIWPVQRRADQGVSCHIFALIPL